VPLEGKLLPRIYIVERIRISYFLALSRVARFYDPPGTERTKINLFLLAKTKHKKLWKFY
jgi:hypothetical protein